MSIPAHLSENSKGIWKAVASKNMKSKQRQTLAQVALECLDRADEARKVIDTEGLLVSAGEGGLKHAHPLLKVEKDSRALFGKLWVQLGLHYEQLHDI